ncbi:MAG TPA: zf-HC2 domain-containing protein [Chthonomonadaceae bacterium]|nr:zf-HC2 domain-containing protein [Chthonomonadaceae bacterium]
MNCREVRARLTALLDKELSANVAARVEAHLATCPSCAQVREEQQALRQLASAWTVESSDVWDAVRRQIEPAEPNALAEILTEMRRLQGEVRALQREVAELRAQVARQTEEARRPSPMLPYPPPNPIPRTLV